MEFDQFYTATRPRLVGSVSLIVGNLAEAEDVAQEAYVRAARHWKRIRDYEDPEAWLRRVALNVALSSLARAKRRATSLLSPTHDRAQLDTAAASDLALDVHRAMLELPRRYRAVLTLHYLHDLPVQEVAQELGLPVETVRSQLARGRRKLHGLVGGDPVETADNLTAPPTDMLTVNPADRPAERPPAPRHRTGDDSRCTP